MLRALALALALGAGLLVSGCAAHLFVTNPSAVYDEAQGPGRARLVTRGDLALVELAGTPEEIGAQHAALLGAPLLELRHGFFEFLPPTEADKARALASAVPEDHRRELQALARGVGLSYVDALLQNVIIDSACTAFVASGAATADGSLLFGRNMDFPPSHLLGKTTLVFVVRPAGKKAFASVAWPGFNGVCSGMNEDGLCAAILVNVGGRPSRDDSAPLAFVVREVLETCADVDQALARLRASDIASDHYITLVDPHRAVVFSQSDGALLPVDGLLTCSNGDVAPEAGLQTDDRSRALCDLLAQERGRLDIDVARAILGATFLEYINAQAMVFEPAARRLSLATGTTLRPAAREAWTRLDLARALRDGGLDGIEVEPLDDVAPFDHYKEHDYAGEGVDRRYADGLRRTAAAVEADATLDVEGRTRRLSGMAFAAALRVKDKALLGAVQGEVVARVLVGLEAEGVRVRAGAPPAALGRAIEWTRRYALPLDAAQAARVHELERLAAP